MYVISLINYTPFACLAIRIDSIVCSLTPSSAATTNTTISVTCAPRLLIVANAACPGVSKNVILLPFSKTTEIKLIRMYNYIKMVSY